MESLFIQPIKKKDPYDWFCGPVWSIYIIYYLYAF